MAPCNAMPRPLRYTYDYAPTIARFARDDSFVRGLMGPFGSGKSSGCVAEIIRRAKAMPKGRDGRRVSRWAVIRNTYRQLEDTTIRTFHQWVPPRFYGTWKNTDKNFIIDRLDPEVYLEVWFRALDRPEQMDNLLSVEYSGAWINEAREVPKEILDGLTGRVGRYPTQEDVGDYWSGIIMDTNPPDSDSWWFKLFEDDRPEDYRVFKQPSGLSEGAENLKFLKTGYYERLTAGKSKDWVKVYVDGEYGFADSGRPIYPEYSDTHHVAEDVIEPSESHPIRVGIDFGLTPAAVIGQLTANRWVILDELVTDDMGAVRFADTLKLLLNDKYAGFEVEAWGDPAGEQRSQVDERTPFMILNKAGIPAVPAPTNDFTLRREAVAKRLSTLAFDGEPQILVSPNCIKLRKAMSGGYKYKRVMAAGVSRYRDKPDKGPLSHIAEALQYLLAGAGEAYDVVRRVEPEETEAEEDDNYPTLGNLGWMGV